MSSPSLVAMYDDLMRRTRILIESDCTKEFLDFVRSQNKFRIELCNENKRLKQELDKSMEEVSKFERKRTMARTLLYQEQQRAETAEAERDELHKMLIDIQDGLKDFSREGGKLAHDAKIKMDNFLRTYQAKFQTSTGEGLYNTRLESIDEINSTGDLLGDLSTSTSDFDIAADRNQRMKKPRKSDVLQDDVPAKRRRSARLSACGLVPVSKQLAGSRRKYNTRQQTIQHNLQIKKTTRDHVVATTTVSVPPCGPVTASSRIETVPRGNSEPSDFAVPSAPPLPSLSSASASSSDSENVPPSTPTFKLSSLSSLTRNHDFTSKLILRSQDECCVCLKPMGFGTQSFKCSECKIELHRPCRDGVPVPCMPVLATPRVGRVSTLRELCSSSPPFVPPLVVRCVVEIERRGLTEHGIYRVPGSEKEVRSLKALLLKLKGTMNLATYDIHVVCGVLKDFFRSLPEPLITQALWQRFADAVRESEDHRNSALYQLVSELPSPNRHTLAYIMVHLWKVSQSPQCMMSKSNLAIVFGPTLVSYSSANPTTTELCNETPLQSMIIDALLSLEGDYWRSVLADAKLYIAVPESMPTPKLGSRRNNTVKSFRMFNSPAK